MSWVKWLKTGGKLILPARHRKPANLRKAGEGKRSYSFSDGSGTGHLHGEDGQSANHSVSRQDAKPRQAADPKEIAEHMMLVDLCRNDIGRICRAGTLNVPEMFSVEKYSHVLHMVSTVTGALDDGVDSLDVVTALFPSGTMTGAPKIRAMEIIESVESSRRGLYAGALGLIDVGGSLHLAP